MKKFNIFTIVCLLLTVFVCFTACTSDDRLIYDADAISKITVKNNITNTTVELTEETEIRELSNLMDVAIQSPSFTDKWNSMGGSNADYKIKYTVTVNTEASLIKSPDSYSFSVGRLKISDGETTQQTTYASRGNKTGEVSQMAVNYLNDLFIN